MLTSPAESVEAVREFLDSDIAFTEVVHELNSLITAFKCTTLLVAPTTGNRPHAEHVLVDAHSGRLFGCLLPFLL
mgnify:CR=1 FL=1